VGNINCLLSKSEADYIMYCDQDDVWFKDKVEVLLKEILHHEKSLVKNSHYWCMQIALLLTKV
jgi:hypothetical protein